MGATFMKFGRAPATIMNFMVLHHYTGAKDCAADEWQWNKNCSNLDVAGKLSRQVSEFQRVFWVDNRWAGVRTLLFRSP
jgi:hypothetical protein